MKNLNLTTIALVVGLAFSVNAMADNNMSKEKYVFLIKNLEANHKLESARCSSLSGNAASICLDEAKRCRSQTLAELNNDYKPSLSTQYREDVAAIRVDYVEAKMKCDGIAGKDKDFCLKEAKAVKARELADAKSKYRTLEHQNL